MKLAGASKFIPYGRQLIDDDDRKAVEEVLSGDWLTQGPSIESFERALAEYCGAKYAVAVSNGTAGLHIAGLAAGLKPGKRSLTSALTFVASANAALYCQAESDLADIDPGTLCLSPQAVEQADNPDVIIPVHFAGLSADSAAIRAQAPNSVIIEDACHALGAQDVDGNMVGSCANADMAVFSFHPVKPITTGEGGAVLTNDEELYRKLLMLRSHGITRELEELQDVGQSQDEGEHAPWYYEQQMLGFNYRMTDIQAALGLSQLKKVDVFTQRRRDIAARYDEAFAALGSMDLAQNHPNQRKRSSHHLYVGLFDYEKMGCSRTAFMKRLRESGVGSQVHYIPVYRQPLHRERLGDVASAYPNTEAYYSKALSLPIFPKMKDEDVEAVIAGVTSAVNG